MDFPVATTCQIQRLDHIAIHDFKIPSLRLMENAGKKCSRIILRGLKPGTKVAIFCGKGNNGGDGFVVGRYLLKAGMRPEIFLIGEKSGLKPDAAKNYRRYIGLGARVKEINRLKQFNQIKPKVKNCSLIVDAIFGVGLKGRLPKFYCRLIDFFNQTQKPIVAIDVPSGLDATSGRCLGNCVRAWKTISFSLAKKGFFRNQGPGRCGEVKIVNIGIPRRLIKQVLKIKCR